MTSESKLRCCSRRSMLTSRRARIPGKTAARQRTASSQSAPAIVFAGGQFVLDHGVADHELDGIGNQERFEAQRAAIEHQGVVLLSVQGNKLVHDADTSSDEFVFRSLAKQRQLDVIRRSARLTGESQRGCYFNGCGRTKTRTHGDFTFNEKIRTAEAKPRLVELQRNSNGIVTPRFGGLLRVGGQVCFCRSGKLLGVNAE